MGYTDENIDVVVSDLNMGDVSGIELLQLWKKKAPDTQFILFTGHSSVNTAVEAIKAGAYDYVTKPINPDELIVLIKRAIEGMQKDKEIDNLRRRLDQKFGLDQIVGQAKQMKDVYLQNPARRPGRQHRPRARRNRHRQRTRRPGPASTQPTKKRPVCRRELRSRSGHARRKRTFRPRPRRLHRRNRPPHGPV